MTTAPDDRITLREIENEMKTAYIDYSMSVIVSRALPDVRDGLKPVHRRVLYAMSELGLASNRPHKKSARIVGEVLGKYHPHGDSSVYDTMVRMAQPWSLRYLLVDGQGNYGSIDNDPPAAMRYTEARMKAAAEAMLADIDKNTVDFVPNFDDSLTEPSVLPAAIPNLLVNGAAGIAVGMATNMAPHNLRECIDGIIAYINNPAIDTAGLMEHVKAPDFPTGGTIYGTEGVRQAYLTGRGRVMLRAKAEIETDKSGREKIVVTEIPYQVVKSGLEVHINQLLEEKKIDGISGTRDESDRDGIRLVIELKKDAVSSVVLNNLYKHTQMQVSFNINNVCLVHGRPQLLNLKDLIRYFVEHRHEVVTRRTQYELDEAKQRANLLIGLNVALDAVDEVIRIIRSSQTPDEARTQLIEQVLREGNLRYNAAELNDLFAEQDLDRRLEMQAKAILDMRLQRLTGLEIEKIKAEYQEILLKIKDYLDILAREERRMSIIADELREVARKFGDERRTKIEYSAEEFTLEDMIANEEVVISISQQGYIKRTDLVEYRAQKRGGTGSRGSATKDDDYIEHLFIAHTHDYLLFFTEKGRCYWLKVFYVPEGGRQTKGRAIQNLIQIEPGDTIRTVLDVQKLTNADLHAGRSIIMCTEKGVVKKTELEAYSRPRQGGINAISINAGDRLIGAALCNESSQVIIATAEGMANRFEASDVRDMGRTATGVRGIRLEEDDRAIGMVVVDGEDDDLLVVSELGFGKRSAVKEYRKTARGTKGVRTLNITEKTGKLLKITLATDDNDLMIITKVGIIIRMHVADIRQLGRNSQGSRLIRMRGSDAIAAVAILAEREEDEDVVAPDNTELPPDPDAPPLGEAPEAPEVTTE